jgi:hypothetical protein
MGIEPAGISLSGQSHPAHLKDVLLVVKNPKLGNASRIILSDVTSLINPSL